MPQRIPADMPDLTRPPFFPKFDKRHDVAVASARTNLGSVKAAAGVGFSFFWTVFVHLRSTQASGPPVMFIAGIMPPPGRTDHSFLLAVRTGAGSLAVRPEAGC